MNKVLDFIFLQNNGNKSIPKIKKQELFRTPAFLF